MKVLTTSLAVLSVAQAWVTPGSVRSVRTALSEAYTLDGEVIRGPITPLGNYVFVKTKDMLSATDGGILLPDQVRNNNWQTCVCVHAWFISSSDSNCVLCCAVLCSPRNAQPREK